jgi:tetratricopeptide (TPR) repeat protein
MMVVIKKSGRKWRWCALIFALASVLCLSGCTPAGPGALLKGERLIREGKYEQALEKLLTATQLLPREARAWNYLGLAYQGSGQPGEAERAYRAALTLDHKLAAARYNLGCLYLEQNKPAQAVDELTSYSLLQQGDVNCWLKLGTAQLRARRIDAAEKCFKTALDLHARNPEALNGLGLIQLQRKRPQDALYFFNLALSQQPNYGPALLNLAIVSQQTPATRPLALAKYRDYLALQPRPSNWEIVSATARDLDAELNPAPRAAVVPPSPVPTNLGPASRTASAAARASSNLALTAFPRATAASNTSPARVVAQTNPPPPNLVASISKPPIVDSFWPPGLPTNRLPDLEVVRLPEAPTVRLAQDVTPSSPVTQALPAAVPKTASVPPQPTNVLPAFTSKAEPKPEKKNLLQRFINPFGGKSKSDPTPPKAAVAVKPDAATNVTYASQTITTLPPAEPVKPPPPPIPRYVYLAPAKPAAGDRHQAEVYFGQGLRDQQAGRQNQARASYMNALRTDPSYFEAYYNLGLAAYEVNDWKQALYAYEYALAILPDSADVRYNFALTLKQAGYLQDAAGELEKVLQKNPSETRAHLTLANLYAQQLAQKTLAREHYLKVLETNPRHPKSADIRYWLAANPADLPNP